jgi:putative ABC transport system permease protein
VRAWLRSWGVSLRLARRGMLRAKGRSLLIIAMIGTPVMALAFAAVTYDTFKLTHDEKMARAMGTSDAIASWFDDRSLDDTSTPTGPQPPPTAKTDDRLLALLPAGSKVVRFSTGGSVVRAQTATGVGRLTSSYLPVGDPAATGMVKIVDGTAPKTDDEISITEAAAGRLGAKVGSKVKLLDPAGEFTVTAIVVIPDDLNEFIVFRPGVLQRQADAKVGGYWLVDLPEGVAPDLPKLRHAGVGLQLRTDQDAVGPAPDTSSTLKLATIAIGLTIFEVVLLCGPAFAVGGRRRQRELALVAANGGTAQQLRRVTQADGIVLGLAGAAGGILLGVPLAIAARPFVEEHLVDRLAGSLRFYPAALGAAVVLAVVTGLLASLVPAFTAARQNVVAALAGRRGITRSRRRWIVLGVVLTAIGGSIAVLGALSVLAEMILAGLVIGQLGLVVLTPSLIGLLGRFGGSLPLTARIALRDTARNRSSAAPAISAVMAVVAGSVMIGIYYYSTQVRQEQQYQMRMPLGYAALGLQSPDAAGHPLDDAQVAQLTSRAAATLPVDRTAVLQTVECGKENQANCDLVPRWPESARCPYDSLPAPGPEREKALADRRCQSQVLISGAVGKTLVDDGTNLAILTGAHGDDLARAQAVLRSGGMVVAEPLLVHDGLVDVLVQRSDGEPGKDDLFTLPGYALTSGVAGFGTVVGPAGLTGHGLAAERGMMLVATTRMPTTAEVDAFDQAAQDINPSSWVSYEAGPGRPDADLGLIVLALASAIVTLAATAVVTGLAAADGRADLTTLAAVGASPRVRRFMSLSQSGVIAGLGTVLGLVAGAAGAYAMIFAINRSTLERSWPGPDPLPLAAPWLMVVGALIVPLIAMLGAGLLTRSRLPIERRA